MNVLAATLKGPIKTLRAALCKSADDADLHKGLDVPALQGAWSKADAKYQTVLATLKPFDLDGELAKNRRCEARAREWHLPGE